MDRRKAAGASGSSHDAMLPRSTLEELTGHELQADRREIIASRWSSRRSCCRSQKENLLGLGSREVMR